MTGVAGSSAAVFAMPVEDVYAITGHGTVLAGVIAQGSISAGSIVQVVGGSSPLRLAVDAIESDRTLVEVAHAGSRVGLLFRATEPEYFRPGMLITGEASTSVESASARVTDTRRGAVKWYHPHDGVGFILPDDGGDDVFFSERNLEQASMLSILPGQRVEFSSIKGEHGPMAVDFREETDAPDSSARATKWSAGTVKWFNHTEGFGFIVQDQGGSDVFVHASALEVEHISTLVEGQRVEFRVFWGAQGPMAESVRTAVSMPPSVGPSDPSRRLTDSAAPETWASPASASRTSSGSRYDGRDCTLTITEDSLLIVHKSMRAQYIPVSLSRLSGCHFELATRWTSGILTIATDGRPIQVPTGTTVGGDPNTVVFKAKSNDVFVGVHTWLQRVIASNGF